jgi:hypothetical protein
VPKILTAAVAGLLAGLLFIGSNVTALHNPLPHDAPVAVAGVAPQKLQQVLDHAQPGAFRAVGARDRAGVLTMIRGRDADGGLVVAGARASVLTASAGGFNAATTIQQALTRAAKPLGVSSPPKPQDVVPLQKGDPAGLTLQQVVLGTILGGFMMGVLSAQLALNEPLRVRVPVRMAFGVAFGGLAALLVGPVIGAFTGHFLWTWLWLGVAAWVISSVVAALADLAANLGILIAYLIMLVIGNPSAAANLPVQFLPGFYRVLGPYLPPNAAANGLLGTTFFDANVLRAALVLGGWGLLALATLYGVERLEGRRTPLAYTAAKAAADPRQEPGRGGRDR